MVLFSFGCPGSSFLEPVLPIRRSHHNEKPHTAAGEQALLTTTRAKPRNEDPGQPKLNKTI